MWKSCKTEMMLKLPKIKQIYKSRTGKIDEKEWVILIFNSNHGTMYETHLYA